MKKDNQLLALGLLALGVYLVTRKKTPSLPTLPPTWPPGDVYAPPIPPPQGMQPTPRLQPVPVYVPPPVQSGPVDPSYWTVNPNQIPMMNGFWPSELPGARPYWPYGVRWGGQRQADTSIKAKMVL